MSTDDRPEEHSPLEYIANGRWEKALFTSYALSLTYFETYVLPQLRKSGCEMVSVLVDKDGYRASLMEMRSRHVGQEYSLIPVSVTSGIFHPKVTYLWGQDEDLLMIGSGNLTFGGHGQNVEVLEVLSSRSDAGVFGEFSRFCEELLRRPNIHIPDRAALDEFMRRAASKANSGSSSGNTKLIHSLSAPIAEQLLELANKRNDWSELLILSPFHSPDGQPIKDIADKLRVSEVIIGVPDLPDDGFSFPFEKAANWDASISAVSPKTGKAGRKLHAKWLELRGQEAWSLTGSVNATFTSIALSPSA